MQALLRDRRTQSFVQEFENNKLKLLGDLEQLCSDLGGESCLTNDNFIIRR